MAAVGRVTLGGTEVEVHASTSGRWRIHTIENEGLGIRLGDAETLEKAEAQARTVLSKMKVKVDVPFFDEDGRRGVAYGRHAGHGNVLARVDGEAVTLNPRRYSNGILAGDTPAHVLARIKALQESIHADKRELNMLRERHGLDLVQAVADAITAKQAESVAASTGQEG